MGQVLHGCATTTHAVRAALQRSKASLKDLAAHHEPDPTTVAKRHKRAFVHDAAMGPKTPRSTVFTTDEEVAIVAFRRYTLLPLEDCLYTFQGTIPLVAASRCAAPRDQPVRGLIQVHATTQERSATAARQLQAKRS